MPRPPEPTDSTLVGSVGLITVPVPAGRPGQVLVRTSGGSHTYAAWSDEPLAKHTHVVVVEARSPRSLTVAALPDWLVASISR